MLPSKKIPQSKRSTTVGNYTFPEDLGQHQIIFMFRKYSYRRSGERTLISSESTSQADIKDVIALPIPANIADSYSIRLSRPEMGIMSEGIASAASSVQSGAASSITEAYKSLQNYGLTKQDTDALLKGNIDSMSANLRYLIRSNLPSFVANGLDLGSGFAVNPKLALSFEGVDLKTHSFDWNFMVRSPGESETLKNIQTAIKRNIHPSYSDLDTIKRAMLSYPSVVDVFFSGLDGAYFVQFKTCMVQSFSLNFTPSGLAIMEGGKPAGAQMSLQLVETDIHTSEDYGGSGENMINYSYDMDTFLKAEKAKKVVDLPNGVQIG